MGKFMKRTVILIPMVLGLWCSLTVLQIELWNSLDIPYLKTFLSTRMRSHGAAIHLDFLEWNLLKNTRNSCGSPVTLKNTMTSVNQTFCNRHYQMFQATIFLTFQLRSSVQNILVESEKIIWISVIFRFTKQQRPFSMSAYTGQLLIRVI